MPHLNELRAELKAIEYFDIDFLALCFMTLPESHCRLARRLA
jgi:hypothetical protein